LGKIRQNHREHIPRNPKSKKTQLKNPAKQKINLLEKATHSTFKDYLRKQYRICKMNNFRATNCLEKNYSLLTLYLVIL
jgi:hypothetical protein